MDANELEIEKLKLNHARERFWIAGVVITGITAIVNWQIQWREIEINQIEQENNHLNRFVDKILDEDPRVRLYISEYFEILSYTSGARKRWSDYKIVAKKRVTEAEDVEKERIRLQVELDDILKEIADPDTSEKRKKELQSELIEKRINIDQTKRLLSAINPSIKYNRSGAQQKTEDIKNDPDIGSIRRLLDVIGNHESSGNYNAYYGNIQNKNNPRFTSFTIDEVLSWQRRQLDSGSPSSAVGKYQMLGKTITRIKSSMNLTGSEMFDERMQDALASHILSRRGLRIYLLGELSVEDFALNLAKEWASLPVLSDTTGFRGNPIKRGQSYYSNDFNSAHVSPDVFEGILAELYQQSRR